MTLKEIISDAKKWSKREQIEFCRFISQNITIAIRSIYSYSDKTDKEKVEAIRWINEFHHRINNVKFKIERVISKEDNIKLIGEHTKFYANQNQIVKGEMSAVLRLSYNATIRTIEHRRKLHLHESIFDLIESDNFRNRTGMYIAENKITSLKGFIDGYFHALDCMEIHHGETEPNFDEFHDWVANYFDWRESTAGWKNIILEESNGDENQAVKLFFEVYDKFRASQVGEYKRDK